jgi:hypothetical protein
VAEQVWSIETVTAPCAEPIERVIALFRICRITTAASGVRSFYTVTSACARKHEKLRIPCTPAVRCQWFTNAIACVYVAACLTSGTAAMSRRCPGTASFARISATRARKTLPGLPALLLCQQCGRLRLRHLFSWNVCRSPSFADPRCRFEIRSETVLLRGTPQASRAIASTPAHCRTPARREAIPHVPPRGWSLPYRNRRVRP